jgi:hypothetical protein
MNNPDLLKTLQRELAVIANEMKENFSNFEADLSISGNSLVLKMTIQNKIGYILPNCVQHI